MIINYSRHRSPQYFVGLGFVQLYRSKNVPAAASIAPIHGSAAIAPVLHGQAEVFPRIDGQAQLEPRIAGTMEIDPS